MNKVEMFDKSGWALHELGDLAKEISIRVDNPKNSKYDRFIGLEHFTSGEIKIKKWGSPDNLTSSVKAFEEGDILFARRNAYLKRASRADFSGVCSGDAFVLRENQNNLVPGFLALIVNSSSLWAYANENAAGTMSKRVKWRDLAEYKLLIPPKEEQIEILKLFEALEAVLDEETLTLEKVIVATQSVFEEMVFESTEVLDKDFLNKKSKFNVKKLADLITDIQYGISESLSENPSEGTPVLRMNNLQNGKLDVSNLKYFMEEEGNLDKFILDKEDILFNRTNSYDLVGKVSLFNEDGRFSFASYLIRVKTNRDILDPRFLNFYLNTSTGLQKIRKYRTPGVSQSNINAKNLKKVPIPCPPIKLQQTLMDKIVLLQNTENKLNKKMASSRQMRKSLLNKVF